MEDISVTRIMPNSLEAEQSVIGSMIMDRQAIITAGEMLVWDDFYNKQYGIMFQSMVEMCNEGKEPSFILTMTRWSHLSGSVTRKYRSSRKRQHRRKLLPRRKRGSSPCRQQRKSLH